MLHLYLFKSISYILLMIIIYLYGINFEFILIKNCILYTVGGDNFQISATVGHNFSNRYRDTIYCRYYIYL